MLLSDLLKQITIVSDSCERHKSVRQKRASWLSDYFGHSIWYLKRFRFGDQQDTLKFVGKESLIDSEPKCNSNRQSSIDFHWFESVSSDALLRKSFTRVWFLSFWPKADHRQLLRWQADLRAEEKKVVMQKYGAFCPYFSSSHEGTVRGIELSSFSHSLDALLPHHMRSRMKETAKFASLNHTADTLNAYAFTTDTLPR